MSDLNQQLEEFETIQSIYDEHKLSFDSKLIAKLQNIAASNSTQPNNPPTLKFTLSITEHILIDCTLPHTYPSATAPRLFIRSTSAKHSKSAIEKGNTLLKSRVAQEFEAGNALLYDLFDWVQENIPSVIIVANFQLPSSSQNMIKQLNLQRSFMWFHHIYSTTKKRNINQLARQYKLTGFCVTGKPGVIVIEGDDRSVNQYIADLKSWNWQRMIVRHSENQILSDNKQFESALKYKKWTFKNIAPHTKGGMKDVYELLKDGDLEDYYKMLVHINTPIDCEFNENKQETNKSDSLKLKFLSECKNGVQMMVNVKPNSKETCIVDMDEHAVQIRIAAQPRDGAANKELCRFIASVMGCAKSNVVVRGGHKSRDKCVLIDNMSVKDASHKLLHGRQIH
eukprot:534958_1